MPFSPVHSCLKFSAALGLSLMSSTKCMRPMGLPLIATSKYTSGSSSALRSACNLACSATTSALRSISLNKAPDVQLVSVNTKDKPQQTAQGVTLNGTTLLDVARAGTPADLYDLYAAGWMLQGFRHKTILCTINC
eukprot:GHRR01014909.1.p2 GENE.GHRR01014909.1~~GHRR01014909.1.p2  ORF type:complete len:136 (-),score=16.80 GHRR01014909.1:585-992(-)